MPRGSAEIEVNASCEAVFDVLHDYGVRLQWDTLLSDARLLDATAAAKGVRSLCTGNWRGAFLPIETEYISFIRGEVAAVRLTNQPFLFEHFAATIRHTALGEGRSRVAYTYSFRSRPQRLAAVIEPMVDKLVARETRLRLAALRDFVERKMGARGSAAHLSVTICSPPSI